MAGDGAHLFRGGWQAARRRGRSRQPRDRGGRPAQGRLTQPDGALRQGRGDARLRRLPRLLRGPDHQDPREQAHGGRLPGHEHHPHQPRRARHRRLRAPAVARPGDDRRLRRARLPGRVGARARGQDQGAGDLEGDDHHLDVRPPDHPGRRVGLLPAPDRRATAGRGRLLRGRGRGARIPASVVSTAHPASASAAAGHSRPLRTGAGRRRGARSRAAAGGAGGDLAAQGLPHARAPRRQRQPARRPAQGRSGARAREPEPDARADVADPRLDPALRRRGGDPAGGAAQDA